jgi:phage/plasmid-like protein (TIGR03299 family)
MSQKRHEPWNRTFDPKPESIEEAIAMAGLDWEVLTKPAFFMNSAVDVHEQENVDLDEIDGYDLDDLAADFRRVPNWFVNVRSDNLLPLGLVSRRYSPFHNIQAFAWLGQIFGTEMEFVAAGDFMNSRRVWVLMRLPKYIEVADEKIGQYAFIHTSHDGKHSVTASMTPYLVSSHTLMTTEVRRAKNFNAKRTIALRHVGNMDEKVQKQQAEEVLGFSVNYYKQFIELGNLLATKKPKSQAVAQEYLETLLPIDEDKMGDRAQENVQTARAQIIKLAQEKAGGMKGLPNWWCFYTAAIEFADWVRPERKEGGRMQRGIDDPDGFKHTAFEMALAAANL